MPRFFVPQENIKGDQLTISGSDVNHIVNVLRMKIGDQFEVFDSSGQVYLVKLKEYTHELIRGYILRKLKEDTELKVDITLAQCLPKGKKMDLIIQKATELGVNRIIPVISERSIPKIEEKEERKLEHWGMIAKEAAEQSGRSRVPEISRLVHFPELMKEVKNYKLAVIPWEAEKKTALLKFLISRYPNTQSRISKYPDLLILIGPEGGFSSEEVKLAKKAGAKPVSLGKRILRCETAAIFSLAVAVSALER